MTYFLSQLRVRWRRYFAVCWWALVGINPQHAQVLIGHRSLSCICCVWKRCLEIRRHAFRGARRTPRVLGFQGRRSGIGTPAGSRVEVGQRAPLAQPPRSRRPWRGSSPHQRWQRVWRSGGAQWLRCWVSQVALRRCMMSILVLPSVAAAFRRFTRANGTQIQQLRTTNVIHLAIYRISRPRPP